MNPLGIVQMVVAAMEGLAQALNPKLRKTEKSGRWKFWLAYTAILLCGVFVIILTVRSLYFSK